MSIQRSFSPRRELGRTGFRATILGIGDLADRSVPLRDCVATVCRAMEAGLNVIDTAPGYEDGYSEQIVGASLKGRRDGMFVIDKIDHMDQPVAPQVEESLRRLEMEVVDLLLFHGCSTMADWRRMAAPGGGMEQLAKCVRAGKCRFRGISSHHPGVLRAAIESGLCDVVMFAVGPFCDSRYIEEILPLARARGVGTVGFKTFGAGKLLGDTSGYGRPLDRRPRGVGRDESSAAGKSHLPAGTQGKMGPVHAGGPPVRARPGADNARPSLPHLSVRQCVHYTLTCDPDVALLGLSVPDEQDAAFEAAADFHPLKEDEMARIRELAGEAIKGKGPAWWNPQGD